jgi:hypothetical protein
MAVSETSHSPVMVGDQVRKSSGEHFGPAMGHLGHTGCVGPKSVHVVQHLVRIEGGNREIP